MTNHLSFHPSIRQRLQLLYNQRSVSPRADGFGSSGSNKNAKQSIWMNVVNHGFLGGYTRWWIIDLTCPTNYRLRLMSLDVFCGASPFKLYIYFHIFRFMTFLPLFYYTITKVYELAEKHEIDTVKYYFGRRLCLRAAPYTCRNVNRSRDGNRPDLHPFTDILAGILSVSLFPYTLRLSRCPDIFRVLERHWVKRSLKSNERVELGSCNRVIQFGTTWLIKPMTFLGLTLHSWHVNSKKESTKSCLDKARAP